MQTKTQWSSQQLKVFSAIKTQNQNLAINAGPGTGKSTVLLESLRLLPRTADIIFLSFSNAIVNELKPKVPSYVNISTLHSLGGKSIWNSYKGAKVNEKKYFLAAIADIPKDKRNKEIFKEANRIQDICTLARMTWTDWNETDNLQAMCTYYGLDYYNDKVLEKSQVLLRQQTKKFGVIDFTDMIWMPASDVSLITKKYDYVMLDEAQDTCVAQRILIKNILKPGGRVILCGDKKQAIYSFTGSTVDSFDLCVRDFEAIEMQLTTTYRCSKSIVAKAAEVYSDIEAFKENEDGVVRRGEICELECNDLVLCRNTKPLIALFFQLISEKKKAFVVGKDLEKGLVSLAESCTSYSKEGIRQNMIAKLNALEVELRNKGLKSPSKDSSYIALFDKIEIISLILSNIDSALDLVSTINQIFDETKVGVKLMTIHRSKGLESDRVFIIENYNDQKLLPSPRAVLNWEKIQERNLEFVAYTRAKKELIFTDLKDYYETAKDSAEY